MYFINIFNDKKNYLQYYSDTVKNMPTNMQRQKSFNDNKNCSQFYSDTVKNMPTHIQRQKPTI